jgi:hypothetical protein
MAYRTVKIYTRPSVDTVYHTKGLAFNGSTGTKENWEIINQKYNTIVRNVTLPDDFNLEVEIIYESEEQYQEYQNDPLVQEHQGLIEAYCAEKGITIGERIEHGNIG